MKKIVILLFLTPIVVTSLRAQDKKKEASFLQRQHKSY
jgi:hypothetical protein